MIYIRLHCLSTIISAMFATNNTAAIAEKIIKEVFNKSSVALSLDASSGTLKSLMLPSTSGITLSIVLLSLSAKNNVYSISNYIINFQNS